MITKNHNHILVDIQQSDGQWQHAGIYLITNRGFLYHKDYEGIPLDPMHLNYRKDGRQFPNAGGELGDGTLPNVLRGLLPGAFAWHQVIRAVPDAAKLSDADKLLWVGEIVRGGISVRGKIMNQREWPVIRGYKALARAQEEAVSAFMKKSLPDGWFLRSFMAGEGGARPKANVILQSPKPGEPTEWVAKFNTPSDRFDMAKVEHFTHELATASGVATARSRVESIDGKNVLLMPRYDKSESGNALYRIALADLTGIENIQKTDIGRGDYLDILNVVRELAPGEVEKLFKQMIFHAALNANDNHLRNFEMMYEEDGSGGSWKLAPNFDSIPDFGRAPSATSFCRFPQREISASFINTLANRFGVDPGLAKPVLEGVINNTDRLLEGLAPDDRDMVLEAIQPQKWSEVVKQLPDTKEKLVDRMSIAPGKRPR